MILTLAAPATAADLPANNLTSNPSFESGTSGWSGWNATIQRMQASSLGHTAPHGGYVARVSWNGASGGYLIDDVSTTVGSSQAGQLYTATAWIRATTASAGKQAVIRIREWADGGVIGSASSPVTLSTTEYRKVEVSYRAIADGSGIDVYAYRPSNTEVSGDAFLIDAITLIPACETDLVNLRVTNCSVTSNDTASAADPVPLWGSIDCQLSSRHRQFSSGGDLHQTATGVSQGNQSRRRLTVIDGDDFYGERCELGRNEHRYGEAGGAGTFSLYGEGERVVTLLSVRLPSGFPVADSRWQGVLQMKQTQPADGGGGGPALSISAFDGRWLLSHSLHSQGSNPDMEQLWSTPAATGVWTRFALDVLYSQDPTQGFVKVYVDLNGDGDAGDSGEQSPGFTTFTLKREITDPAGQSNDLDGIGPGESIPSHLRVGLYHHPDIPCPPPNGCSVDVDNLQVVGLDG